MRRRLCRRFPRVATLMLLTPLVGCAVAADVLNPDLLSGLGFDPASIVPLQGRVVIAFQNSTGFPASFGVVVSDDAADPTSNAFAVFDVQVDSGQVRQRVVDCPVGVVTPGAFAVFADVGQVDIALTEAAGALTAGSDFLCGDVLLYELQQVGAGGEEATFRLRISVLPGR